MFHCVTPTLEYDIHSLAFSPFFVHFLFFIFNYLKKVVLSLFLVDLLLRSPNFVFSCAYTYSQPSLITNRTPALPFSTIFFSPRLCVARPLFLLLPCGLKTTTKQKKANSPPPCCSLHTSCSPIPTSAHFFCENWFAKTIFLNRFSPFSRPYMLILTQCPAL